MLQQTQISRVLPKYEEWLAAFPTIESLVRAPFPKALKVWHGLGYNRRARHLKDAAMVIARKYKGHIPEKSDVLETLPGIGHYTAGAVACFAYGTCKEPFLDTNIRRVFLHFFKPSPRGKIGDRELIRLVRGKSPERPTRAWYYALMDYGREVLGKRRDNPNRAWVGYARQSKFIGSRRYARAKILECLLNRGRGAEKAELRKFLEKYPPAHPFLADYRLQEILFSLRRDNLIRQNGRLWAIVS